MYQLADHGDIICDARWDAEFRKSSNPATLHRLPRRPKVLRRVSFAHPYRFQGSPSSRDPDKTQSSPRYLGSSSSTAVRALVPELWNRAAPGRENEGQAGEGGCTRKKRPGIIIKRAFPSESVCFVDLTGLLNTDIFGRTSENREGQVPATSSSLNRTTTMPTSPTCPTCSPLIATQT